IRPSDVINAAPAAVTGLASEVTPASARLNGSVNPHGKETTYHFEYGTSTGYGGSTPIGNAGSGTTPTSVSAHIEGLVLNTTYHCRVVATNSEGTSYGTDRTFVAKERKAAPWVGLVLF
ncbi:MAG: fibronectin type III domain-containing protein, partial [Thermodesulfobacteriota bacterium]|nr:fibronectin type III domain-containing protein [Thermodesulfobacteriota bacterium]